MSWSIKSVYSFQNRYIRIRLSSAFCLTHVKSAFSDIEMQPGWRQQDSLLIDASLVEIKGIKASDIDSMSEMFLSMNSKMGISRVAIIACSDLYFGFARLFQVKTESHKTPEIRAFRLAAPAIAWLTIERSQIAQPRPDADMRTLGAMGK